jgi:hypothetical protein
MSSTSSDLATIQLPPGVTFAGWRETSQLGANGNVEQGIAFTLRLPEGGTTTVFIPHQFLNNTAAISAAFNRRLADIQSILGLAQG